jgi:Protein of unknown function (DUF3293)
MQRIATLTTQLRSLVRTAEMDRVALRQKQLMKLLSRGSAFGIMSAYGPGSKKQNKDLRTKLITDLQKAKYRVEPLKGSWEGVGERSVLIKKIPPDKLFQLGRDYKQDSVIYKSKDDVIGMYFNKTKVANVAVDSKGDPVFEMATDKSLFSKARGLSFEFGFLWGQDIPWDGIHPISRKVLRRYVKDVLKFDKNEDKND